MAWKLDTISLIPVRPASFSLSLAPNPILKEWLGDLTEPIRNKARWVLLAPIHNLT